MLLSKLQEAVDMLSNNSEYLESNPFYKTSNNLALETILSALRKVYSTNLSRSEAMNQVKF